MATRLLEHFISRPRVGGIKCLFLETLKDVVALKKVIDEVPVSP
jgi:hypothetical protein